MAPGGAEIKGLTQFKEVVSRVELSHAIKAGLESERETLPSRGEKVSRTLTLLPVYRLQVTSQSSLTSVSLSRSSSHRFARVEASKLIATSRISLHRCFMVSRKGHGMIYNDSTLNT